MMMEEAIDLTFPVIKYVPHVAQVDEYVHRYPI